MRNIKSTSTVFHPYHYYIQLMSDEKKLLLHRPVSIGLD